MGGGNGGVTDFDGAADAERKGVGVEREGFEGFWELRFEGVMESAGETSHGWGWGEAGLEEFQAQQMQFIILSSSRNFEYLISRFRFFAFGLGLFDDWFLRKRKLNLYIQGNIFILFKY